MGNRRVIAWGNLRLYIMVRDGLCPVGNKPLFLMLGVVQTCDHGLRTVEWGPKRPMSHTPSRSSGPCYLLLLLVLVAPALLLPWLYACLDALGRGPHACVPMVCTWWCGGPCDLCGTPGHA